MLRLASALSLESILRESILIHPAWGGGGGYNIAFVLCIILSIKRNRALDYTLVPHYSKLPNHKAVSCVVDIF